MPDLSRRHLQPEWMDDPALDAARHRGALVGLARINWWSGSARILFPPLAALARERQRPLRILDIATGGGDVPLALARRARRRGLDFRVAGCDVSPRAVEHARAGGSEAEFFVHDALAAPLPTGYDAITSSLFLHHLEEEAAVELLRRMAAAAGSLVLINDLERTRRGYLLAWVGTRLLSRCDVVHHDGPRSVEGAFTAAEARGLAEQAGLVGAVVRRRWPSRYLLEWRKPA